MKVNFEDENKKLKRNLKNETLTTLLKSFETFVIIATTSTSITLPVTEIVVKVIPT